MEKSINDNSDPDFEHSDDESEAPFEIEDS